ncbi:MAG: dockerin type I repeat-containing protein [Clostridia bacterium]
MRNWGKKGISLIVLIVTIVIIIILASAMMLMVSKNNPVQNGRDYTSRANMDTLRDNYELTYAHALAAVDGKVDKLRDEDFSKVVPDHLKVDFEATKKGLRYIGNNEAMRQMAKDMDIDIEIKDIQTSISNVEIIPASDKLDIKITALPGTEGIKNYTYKIRDKGITTWEGAEYTLNESNFVKSGLISNHDYEVQALVTDNKDRRIESQIYNIKTLDLNTPTFGEISKDWTKGPVEVTIYYPKENTDKSSTKTSINQWSYTGAEGSYQNVSESEFTLKLRENTTIFARSTDNKGNISQISKLAIENIDILEPRAFTPQIINKTTNSITVKGITQDASKTATSGASGIRGYKFSKDDGKTWTAEQKDTQYTFNNILVENEFKIKVKAIDNASNETISAGISSKTEKLEKPIITLIPKTWTNGAVTARINYSNIAGTLKQYSVDGINWITTTSTVYDYIVRDCNTVIYAKITDESNQTSQIASATVLNIDRLAPKDFITSATDIRTNSIKVKGIAEDADATSIDASSKIEKYQFRINGGEWTAWQVEDNYTFTNLTQSTTYQIQQRAIDKTGNIKDAVAINVTTHTIPGEKIDDIVITQDPVKWTNGKVNVSISYTTRVPGLTGMVSTDNITWEKYTGNIIVDTNNTTVYAKLIDSTSQQGPIVSKKITNIDKIPPTTSIAPNGGVYIMPTEGANATIKAHLSASDTGGSGLGTVQYAWSALNSNSEPSNWTNYLANGEDIQKTDATAGTYYLWIKVIDVAGNRAESIKKSNAYIVKPNMDETTLIQMIPSTTSWTNKDVGVRIIYGSTLTAAKLARVQSGTGVVNSIESVVMQTNGVVYAQATDVAGNKVSKTLSIPNIDKLPPNAPTVNLNGYSSGSWTNDNITQNFSATDAPATSEYTTTGISKYNYSHNASSWNDVTNPWVINWDGQWTFYIRAIDGVGNASAASSPYTVRRDTVAPTLGNVSISTSASSITATVSGATDNASGINNYSYYLNGIIWSNTGNNYTYGGLAPNTYYTVSYKVRDNAGNETQSGNTGARTLANIPSGITATNGASSQGRQITVAWNENENPAGTVYELEQSDNASTWSNIYTGTASSFVHTGLATNTAKYYRVRAKNADGVYTEYSGNATGKTLATPNASINVTGNGVNSTTNRVQISWPAVQGATSYGLSIFDGYAYRYTNIGNATSFDSNNRMIYPTTSQIAVWNPRTSDPFRWGNDGTYYAANGNPLYLKANSSYTTSTYYTWIHIYAYDASGRMSGDVWNGALSLCGATVDTDPPNEFTPVVNSINTNTISISGSTTDLIGGVGVSSYQYRINGGAWQNSKTFNNLTPNTSYTLQMRAIDANGNYRDSNTISSSTTDVLTPTITPNITSWTRNDVRATISQASGFTSQYRIDFGTWTTATYVDVTTNCRIDARYINDTSQSGGLATCQITNIDKTPPVTTFNPNGAETKIGGTDGVKLSTTATSSDEGCGVASKKYQWSTSSSSAPTTWLNKALTNTYQGYLYGDVNQDGNISGADALLVDKYLEKLATLTDVQKVLADVNGDEKVDKGDVLEIQQKVDRIISEVSIVGNIMSMSTTSSGTYYLWTKTTDKLGNTEIKVSNSFKSGIGTITPSTTKVTSNLDLIVSTVPNHKQQLLVNGTYKDGTSFNITSNGTYYARWLDSSNNVTYTASIQITNIDNVPPNEATFGLPGGELIPDRQASFTINTSDNFSGINVGATKYKFSTSPNIQGVNNTGFWNASDAYSVGSVSYTFNSSLKTTSYLHVLSVDNVGNKTETVSAQIKVMTKALVDIEVNGPNRRRYLAGEANNIDYSGYSVIAIYNTGERENVTNAASNNFSQCLNNLDSEFANACSWEAQPGNQLLATVSYGGISKNVQFGRPIAVWHGPWTEDDTGSGCIRVHGRNSMDCNHTTAGPKHDGEYYWNISSTHQFTVIADAGNGYCWITGPHPTRGYRVWAWLPISENWAYTERH